MLARVKNESPRMRTEVSYSIKLKAAGGGLSCGSPALAGGQLLFLMRASTVGQEQGGLNKTAVTERKQRTRGHTRSVPIDC